MTDPFFDPAHDPFGLSDADVYERSPAGKLARAHDRYSFWCGEWNKGPTTATCFQELELARLALARAVILASPAKRVQPENADYARSG